MNWLFASDGQSIGPSASASVLPVNIQGGVPLGLASLISLLSKGLSGVSPTAQFQSISSSVLSLLYDPTLTFIHDYWENYSFDYMDLCQQMMSFLFKMLSRFVIGEGGGTPLQYSCLENPMDGGTWEAAVHGVMKS